MEHTRFNGIHWNYLYAPLQWRHNGLDGVSNHQPYHCLLNRLFGHRSKKTSKIRVTGLCAGKSPGTGEFPAQRASNAENVSIWWRHHDTSRNDHGTTTSEESLYALWGCPFIFIFVWRQTILKLTHLPWTKWPSFRRRYFQMHIFRERKVLYFDQNFIEVCS